MNQKRIKDKNLDNWKSSRRKRQEHIIERVVEVKKLAAEEEIERSRRKSKTFSEMIEDRTKGRHKFTIPVYDDDGNDLSDYGIGSCSSKANSVKDADTDDSGSLLDEKEHTSEFGHNKVNVNSVPSQDKIQDPINSCDNQVLQKSMQESCISIDTNVDITSRPADLQPELASNKELPDKSSNLYRSSATIEMTVSPQTPNASEKKMTSYISKKEKPDPPAKPSFTHRLKADADRKHEYHKKSEEHYTYEGAIQDYRTRIRSKINIDESFLIRTQNSSKNKEPTDSHPMPRGEIFKRKEVFESDKPVGVKSYESNVTRRLSEDFLNTQSIKQRLKNLEKCTDQCMKETAKSDVQAVSVRERLQTFNKQNDNERNNRITDNQPNKISNYIIKKSHSSSSFSSKSAKTGPNWQREEISDRSSSPETELYMNKLNIFSRDLDNLMIYGKVATSLDNRNGNFYLNSNYTPSTSSTEFLGLSSDREDSGIHTADVSCSVSQADESADIAEMTSKNPLMSDVDNFSDKKNSIQNTEMSLEAHSEDFSEESADCDFIPKSSTPTEKNPKRKDEDSPFVVGYLTKSDLIKETQELLYSLQRDASENLCWPKPVAVNDLNSESSIRTLSGKNSNIEAKRNTDANKNELENINNSSPDNLTKSETVIYENVAVKPLIITDELMDDSNFPLAPPKLEPPKVKPPPPPPADGDHEQNSTQRIKKEINVKRSSFLGLYDTLEDHIPPRIATEKPPDMNYFLQRESKLEKSLYKKLQEENRMGILNKVASQDSGLDVDRGRLSSDTWCSSTGESTTPSHDRQDSDHTNSITSEEDEISKKEREIIEMVEKEEKSRDVEFSTYQFKPEFVNNGCAPYEKFNKFTDSFYPSPSTNYIEDQDSEVLKVEQELRQLEREELDRQKENLLFKESRAKAHFHNRHSLENICDEIFSPFGSSNNKIEHRTGNELRSVPQEYRKSMPDVLSMYQLIPDAELHYRKSMPEIQHTYRNNPECCKSGPASPSKIPVDHCRSLPELKHDVHCSAFKSPISRAHMVCGKSSRLSQKENEEYMTGNSPEMESQAKYVGKPRQLTRHSLHTLSAVPRPKHTDSWVRPEPKNYNQHWVYQEAELRRLSNQHKSISNQNQVQPPKKHIPDSIIQTLTQRVQNRANEWNPVKRTVNNLNKGYVPHQFSYHSSNVGRVLPSQYNNNNNHTNNRTSIPIVDSQERMLSVSGKKKCSYCGNELGRGAAMIIESLHLFYHMECFKCCVCHVQLGDGLMGTDVRVRNQKLHCHNCYSSDDGVKFSCV